MIQAQVLEKEIELANKEKYLAQLASLSQELEKYKEELSKIDFAIPEGAQLPSFFKFLEKSCSENGLVLKSIGRFTTITLRDEIKKDVNLKKTQIDVAVSGKFEDFIKFILILEKSARLIQVSNFSLGLPEEGVSDIFSFNIKMIIHSY